MLLLNTKITLLHSNLQHLKILILLSISLVSCNFNHNSILIENITEKKLGKTVRVTGTIKELAPLIRGTGYRLQDDTGSVWVITSRGLPLLETEITIRGTVQSQGIIVKDKNLSELYLVELQQLANPLEPK